MKNMKWLLKILKNISAVFIFILASFIMINLFQRYVLKLDHPSFFGYSYFKVVSNSMAPTIKKGDFIIVKEFPEYKVKDIITYKKDKSFITHRIIKIDDYLYTQGDYNNVGDEKIKKDQVVGKVTKILKGVGVWQDILFTPKILILLIITLLLFNNSFKDWTKSKYYYLQDFKISKNSIIEERNKK